MRKNNRKSDISILFQASLLASLSVAIVSAASAQEVNPEQLATTVDDGFVSAIVGDITISYPLDRMMSDPGFRAVVELIQGADASTGNLEGNIIDGRNFRGSVGGGFGGEPQVVEWVKEMGFDIVSGPNNHADDFGREGLVETSSHLHRAGLQYAGYGDSYWAAKAARVYSSPRGRVGMVAVSDHDPSIADYLPVFAKAAIDNGADLFQGTGVHALRGIEIYDNRPIFYGLGEFIRQMDVIGLSGRGDPRRSIGPPDAEFPLKLESIALD